MKGHVLHRARAHLRVPGCSLVWNMLLTKKLPMFLSRLNEINGGCEKILPVSGSFSSNLKFFRMIDFTARILGSQTNHLNQENHLLLICLYHSRLSIET